MLTMCMTQDLGGKCSYHLALWFDIDHGSTPPDQMCLSQSSLSYMKIYILQGDALGECLIKKKKQEGNRMASLIDILKGQDATSYFRVP